MKNFIRYFFSILLMISCLMLFAMVAYKTLFVEEGSGNMPPVDGPQAEEEGGQPDGENGDGENETAQPEVPVEPVAPVKPDPNAAPFTTADASYFADALFIGDSRTVGLKEYGQIEGADFFCTTGMNVYKVRDEVVNVGSVGSVTLDQLLSAKTYGKIYLMLGINELGWNGTDIFRNQSAKLIERLQADHPDATIVIQSILPVSAKQDAKGSYVNNQRIDAYNQVLQELAETYGVV